MGLLELLRNGGMQTSGAVNQATDLARQSQQQLMQDYAMAQANGYQGTFDDYVSSTTSVNPTQQQTMYPRFVAGTPSMPGLIYQMAKYFQNPNTSLMR